MRQLVGSVVQVVRPLIASPTYLAPSTTSRDVMIAALCLPIEVFQPVRTSPDLAPPAKYAVSGARTQRELLWSISDAQWNLLGYEHLEGRSADYTPTPQTYRSSPRHSPPSRA